MSRPYDVITFDCYGTLIDWEAGIASAFAAATRRSRPVDVRAAVALHAEIEPVVEAEAFRSYWEVLTETARRVAARLDWPLPDGNAGFLAESLPAWLPFPDTNRALRRIAGAGYRLGILSNVDDGLLVWSRRHLGAFFEIVVTADQVRSYKPAPGHFIEAKTRIGGATWLHVAQSYFHDVVPAHALGVPVAWINRKKQPRAGAARPDREFTDLQGLADWLTESQDARLTA
jgi:2-haloacid dehalogenase/putative hydrolase of the HAD superfamily